MFSMTVSASQLGIVLVHRTMQSDHVLHLLRDLAVAVDTQIGHPH
jgi:hypothetical protein